ncbi:hypothetical protein AAVH_31451 [Aphelenchoides avenae]|nr:hypothetical protein AAVH_31451 [Aphelenchus avenae]
MSSALSSGAIHLIVGFVEGNVTNRRKSNRSSTVRSRKDSLSMERRLLLKNALGDTDMQDVFAHGKPLVYDGEDYPRLFVPKIVEAFQHLKEEPAFFDITIAVPRKNVGPWCTNKVPISMVHPTEVWPQAYHSYLPCATCTTVEASKVWRIKNKQPPAPPSSLLHYVVEKIHVSSKHFGKQLTVELHFNLGDLGKVGDGDVPVRPPTASNTEKIGLHKVVIRMSDGVCSASVLTSMARKSKSVLLIPDIASEVYGFIDRVHAGTSLIANRGLNELIFKLRHQLPIHHLMCEFEEVTVVGPVA